MLKSSQAATAVCNQPIRDAVVGCINIWNVLCAKLNNDSSALNSDAATQNLSDKLENEKARFLLWSGHLGARQQQKASLDYRLREASEMTELVLELLATLKERLILFDTVYRKQSPESDEIRVIEQNSDGGSEDEMDAHSINLISSISHIIASVDNLYRLSKVIRNPVPEDRYRPSAKVDLSCFAPFERSRLLEKFPKLDNQQWLVDRLSSSNIERRQFLRYREEHYQRLSQYRASEATNQEHNKQKQDPAILEDKLISSKSELAKTSTELRTRQASEPTFTIEDTVATPYVPQAGISNPVNETDDAQTIITYANSVSNGRSNLRPPQMPKAAIGGQPFFCNICHFPEQLASEQQWRKHVFEDLQPYMCLFEQCAAPLFSSLHAWFDHELQTHRRSWSCMVCAQMLPNDIALRLHLDTAHGRRIPDELWSLLVQTSIRSAVAFKPSECPFCSDWVVMQDNSSTEQQDLHVNIEQFRKHVGRHLEDVALFVLPLKIEEVSGSLASGKAVGEEETIDASNDCMSFQSLGDWNDANAEDISSIAQDQLGTDVGNQNMASRTSQSRHDSNSSRQVFANFKQTMDEGGVNVNVGAWMESTSALSVKSIDEKDFQDLPQVETPAPKVLQPSRYKTGKTIAAGSSAVIKECVHIETGRYYAARVLKKRLFAGREYLIRNEIAVLKRVTLGHPNIIGLVDYFETENNLYLILDLVLGGELFDRICRKGNYFESDALKIIRTIVSAIGFLHDHGIVHRNLKPEKILFRTPEDNSDVLIGGFDLARIMEDESNILTTTCGTPGYMAPEVFTKSGHGKAVDMWAVGVITYFLLCGYTPFDRATNLEEMQAILVADYSFTPKEYWEHVSKTAKDFINRCLTISPVERIRAHQALLHSWLATTHESTDVADPPHRQRNSNPRRTLRAGIWVVLAIQRLQLDVQNHTRVAGSQIP